MEWSDLRLFLAIAREGTLGAASRRLNLTQPTMGRRLKALEEAMGRSLFQRTRDGFVLTDEGEIVLAHAERIEEEAIALTRELAGSDGQLDGQLRVSCSDWFGIHVLAPIMANFSKQYPKVTVELLTDARLLNLSRREADLVFRIKPFSEPEVISRKLMAVHYGLYAADKLPDIAFDGAGNTPLIIMDEAFGSMPDVAWLRGLFPAAPIALRSNNRDVQARLCLGGAGLAVLPRPLGDSLTGLKRLDPPTQPPSRETWLGYHRDLRRLPRLRAFLNTVIQSVSPSGFGP